ncbi:MAG: hypothetical protein M1828_001062 [Chrysothrix sp. TS-e1954]|nr:MAG: hypothetical protein M1828_001062 [Chrysothrix sp. TS-e1954]
MPPPQPPNSDGFKTDATSQTDSDAEANSLARPHPRPSCDFPKVVFRIRIEDLSLASARRFTKCIADPYEALASSVEHVLRHLYSGYSTTPAQDADLLGSARDPSAPWPGTRSITLIIDNHDGVAFTTGKELDGDHKEIHMSCRHLDNQSNERLESEIRGVLVHEMVHAWQHFEIVNGPGGLMEGIADWVRLKAGHSPPYWRKKAGEKWDQGYQWTAYFLRWLEGRKGGGKYVVPRINDLLSSTEEYDEKAFWSKAVGEPVDKLWKEYVESLKQDMAAPVGEDGSEMTLSTKERTLVPANEVTQQALDNVEAGRKMEGEGLKQKEKGQVMLQNGIAMVNKGKAFVEEGEDMIQHGRAVRTRSQRREQDLKADKHNVT